MHNLSNYYEAILQLRPKNKKLLEFVLNQIKKNNIDIAEKKELKQGLNFYLSSRKFTLQLGKKLKKSFNGELKITKTLHTKNRLTSKRIYRITVLFKLKQ